MITLVCLLHVLANHIALRPRVTMA